MKSFKEYLQEAKNPNPTKIIARLEYLSNNLNKYSHTWGDNPSNRMTSWVDEYNDLKDQYRDTIWRTYCDKNKFSYSHNAYDCLA